MARVTEQEVLLPKVTAELTPQDVPVPDLTTHEIRFLIGGIGLGLAVGATVGYFIARKKMELKYAQIADQEIADMKEHYLERERDVIRFQEELASQPKPNLDAVMDEMNYQRKRSTYTPEEQAAINEVVAEEEEEERRNIFESLPAWDYSEEMKKRDPERPYVIHKDEFEEGIGDEREPEWQQGTLSYFDGDDVLTDERDHVIDADRESVVGDANLLRFGHGSGDPNVVYVRNEYMTIDIEIVRSPGLYAEEVHGIIEHSDYHRRHRRRHFDDE
jgi:hypothetical protein